MSDGRDPAKAEPSEPSMEDVLASIRRILSEDALSADASDGGTPGRPPAAPADEEATSVAAGDEAVPAAARKDRSLDSDVALTEEDSGEAPPAPSPASPKERAMPSMHPATRKESGDPDVFTLTPSMKAAAESKLLSAAAAESSTDVLSQLARAILDRRDIAVGSREATLEDMVRSMLRPLLKEWLDRNLPYIIERLVKKELDLMVNRAERLED